MICHRRNLYIRFAYPVRVSMQLKCSTTPLWIKTSLTMSNKVTAAPPFLQQNQVSPKEVPVGQILPVKGFNVALTTNFRMIILRLLGTCIPVTALVFSTLCPAYWRYSESLCFSQACLFASRNFSLWASKEINWEPIMHGQQEFEKESNSVDSCNCFNGVV